MELNWITVLSQHSHLTRLVPVLLFFAVRVVAQTESNWILQTMYSETSYFP
jgi:hypothetical protein